jgi:glycosyltransferase involved in cell wall biosynthesis
MVIGRMVKAKGFEYVIDAMKSIQNGHLLIVGDGPNKDALIAQAERLGLSDSVTFTGSQSDTAPFYQASDCFVMSSIYEPLGQTILEALACGLPIVAFNDNLVTTATKEMLSDNEAAYVDALSADELAATLNDLMADEKKSNRLSQSSRDIAVGRFSWDSLAKNMLAQFGGDSVR